MKNILIAITVMVCLSGCSWEEKFIVRNTSQSELLVRYTLEAEKGSSIFEDQPMLYKLNKSHELDYSSQQVPTDLDTSSVGVKVRIPAGHALVFGHLLNDHYKAYNQEFINGYVFDLKELTIFHNSDTITILPASFDTYFKKTNGLILFDVR